MSRCKITVVNVPDPFSMEYAALEGLSGPCEIFRAGDVYFTEGAYGMPAGFCPEAWYAIEREVYTIGGGGLAYGAFSRYVACCNDGIRPVSFLLERVD